MVGAKPTDWQFSVELISIRTEPPCTVSYCILILWCFPFIPNLVTFTDLNLLLVSVTVLVTLVEIYLWRRIYHESGGENYTRDLHERETEMFAFQLAPALHFS